MPELRFEDIPEVVRATLLADVATYGRCYISEDGTRLHPVVIEREGSSVRRRFRREDEAAASYMPRGA